MDHYCGKRIQNELIELPASLTLNHIPEKLRKSKYYSSVILDCTPYISDLEKLSFVVRFVDVGANPVKVSEHFLEF